MKTRYIFFVLLFFRFTSQAQYGVLDNSFGSSGIVKTAFGPTAATLQSLAIQKDGKIVATGERSGENFFVVRYNVKGTLDTLFGDSGYVSTDLDGEDRSTSVAIQPDGKILVAGTSRHGVQPEFPEYFALVRYNTDGSLDAEFASGGKLLKVAGHHHNKVYTVLIRPDGKIVVVGDASFGSPGQDICLLQCNADGTIDSTFGTGGTVRAVMDNTDEHGYSAALQPDGKIVVTGYTTPDGQDFDFLVMRFNSNGTLDNNFGNKGVVKTSIADYTQEVGRAIAIQPDGTLIIAGYAMLGSDNDIVLMRYKQNGSLDNTFSGDGKVMTSVGQSNDFASSLLIQPDGKILIAGGTITGTNWDFVLARYDSAGTLDNSFGSSGTVITAVSPISSYVTSIALAPDGKIVAGGIAEPNSGPGQFALARYSSGLPTGVNTVHLDRSPLRAFPNPATDVLHLSFELKRSAALTIEVVNSTGHLIQSQKVSAHEGYNVVTLRSKDLSPGVYLGRLINSAEGTSTMTRVVILEK
jgi:uncharacterized delta-60 repeat protein